MISFLVVIHRRKRGCSQKRNGTSLTREESDQPMQRLQQRALQGVGANSKQQAILQPPPRCRYMLHATCYMLHATCYCHATIYQLHRSFIASDIIERIFASHFQLMLDLRRCQSSQNSESMGAITCTFKLQLQPPYARNEYTFNKEPENNH